MTRELEIRKCPFEYGLLYSLRLPIPITIEKKQQIIKKINKIRQERIAFEKLIKFWEPRIKKIEQRVVKMEQKLEEIAQKLGELSEQQKKINQELDQTTKNFVQELDQQNKTFQELYKKVYELSQFPSKEEKRQKMQKQILSITLVIGIFFLPVLFRGIEKLQTS